MYFYLLSFCAPNPSSHLYPVYFFLFFFTFRNLYPDTFAGNQCQQFIQKFTAAFQQSFPTLIICSASLPLQKKK